MGKKFCKGSLTTTCNTPSDAKACTDSGICKRISCLCDSDDDCNPHANQEGTNETFTCADNSKSEEKMPVENKVITEVISCKYCSASQASGASNGNETARSSVTMYTEEKVEIFFAGKTGRIKLSRAGHETDWRTFDGLSPEALAAPEASAPHLDTGKPGRRGG